MMADASITAGASASYREEYTPILIGVVGAALVGLGFIAPWTVGVLAACIVFALSFVENERFLLLVIFLLPFNIILGPSAPIRDFGMAFRTLVLVGFFLGRMSRGQLQLRSLLARSTSRAWGLFLGALVLSAVFADPEQLHVEIRGIYFIACFFSIYLMMLSWVDSRERVRKVLLSLFASTICVAIFACCQTIHGDYTSLWYHLYGNSDFSEWTGRSTSFLGHPNALGAYLNLILPLSLGCSLLGDDRLLRRVSVVTTVLATIALACTQSRAPYLAFGVMAVFAIWYFVAGSRKKKLALTVCLLILAIGIYSFSVWLAPKRFEVSGDQSTIIRLMLWGVAWTLFQSAPVLGIGLGSFPLIYHLYLPSSRFIPLGLEVHNVYIELVTETGVLGLLAFLFLIARALKEASRDLRSNEWLARALAFGMTSGVLAMLLESFFDHNLLWSGQVGSLCWLLLGTVATGVVTQDCQASLWRKSP